MKILLSLILLSSIFSMSTQASRSGGSSYSRPARRTTPTPRRTTSRPSRSSSNTSSRRSSAATLAPVNTQSNQAAVSNSFAAQKRRAKVKGNEGKVHRASRRYQKCYRESLAGRDRDESLKGAEIDLKFQVNRYGEAQAVSASAQGGVELPSGVSRCISNVTKSLRFDRPSNGKAKSVNMTTNFFNN